MKWDEIFNEEERNKAIHICELKIDEFNKCEFSPSPLEYRGRKDKIKSNGLLSRTDIVELWCFYKNNPEYERDNLYKKLDSIMCKMRNKEKENYTNYV